ncbi:Microsomal glutathione S-transferase 1 [Holothuria leucospilota]|uniref:Microsomal glutathione S-transferase 1 n=1 Tax=Holothuria leucospilota TaxID=206669 RepID=A0A9Q1C5B0_HOLLE|nr:Microsomal glutathione S-transferase 1 [Holothuria leucospilota]
MDGLFSSPQFHAYAKYGTIAILKMMILGPLTATTRRLKGFYSSNPEDYKAFSNLSSHEISAHLTKRDPYIERIRRCHRNDLENIIPFITFGFLYVSVANPSLEACLWRFRVFLAARILHTVCYLVPLPQPSRLLAFAVGWIATVSMGWAILTS